MSTTTRPQQAQSILTSIIVIPGKSMRSQGAKVTDCCVPDTEGVVLTAGDSDLPIDAGGPLWKNAHPASYQKVAEGRGHV